MLQMESEEVPINIENALFLFQFQPKSLWYYM